MHCPGSEPVSSGAVIAPDPWTPRRRPCPSLTQAADPQDHLRTRRPGRGAMPRRTAPMSGPWRFASGLPPSVCRQPPYAGTTHAAGRRLRGARCPAPSPPRIFALRSGEPPSVPPGMLDPSLRLDAVSSPSRRIDPRARRHGGSSIAPGWEADGSTSGPIPPAPLRPRQAPRARPSRAPAADHQECLWTRRPFTVPP